MPEKEKRKILSKIESLIADLEKRHKNERCGCFDEELHCIATLGLRSLANQIQEESMKHE